MERVLKCSDSRMAHLILPERKENESNEKRRVAAVGGYAWWCSSNESKRGEAGTGHCRVQKQQDDEEQRYGEA